MSLQTVKKNFVIDTDDKTFSLADPLQAKKVRKVPPGLPSSVSAHIFTCGKQTNIRQIVNICC